MTENLSFLVSFGPHKNLLQVGGPKHCACSFLDKQKYKELQFVSQTLNSVITIHFLAHSVFPSIDFVLSKQAFYQNESIGL